jgi:hypothetical protein
MYLHNKKTTSNLERMEYIIVNDFLNIITNRYVLRSSTYFWLSHSIVESDSLW